MNATEIARYISETLALPEKSVINVIALLNDGATVPFIARYRKELSGNLDEIAVRGIEELSAKVNELEKRKMFILDAIEKAGALTTALRDEIAACMEANRLEDLYLPYKPKRKTRATIAKERGLEPLAKIIMSQRSANIAASAARFVKGEVSSVEDAIAGASDIIAEWVSENPSVRRAVRNSLWRNGSVCSRGDAAGTKYADYADFSRDISRMSPHAFLALQRAEKEGVVKLSVKADETRDVDSISRRVVHSDAAREPAEIVNGAVKDAYKRLVLPSMTNEVLADLKERSDEASIALFADGLRQVLLYPPIKAQPVLGIDPGFRTGCKVACINAEGDLLEYAVIYPVEPHRRTREAAEAVLKMLSRHGCKVIALGDGTASRETEAFLHGIGLPDGVKVERVSEQGASIYSASELARKEFPDLDLTYRSAISIARRLQDPLAELVKIDPKSIGVGQYQHDVNQKRLKDALKFTVELCVNDVGVNLNTASAELLSYVSGIGSVLASNIVEYRTEHGEFASRRELLKVPRLGAKAFEQASGFLRISDADNPLDNSAVHPERYRLVERMAKDLGCPLKSLIGNDNAIDRIDADRYVGGDVGRETIDDILAELRKPGRDPREAVETEWHKAAVSSIDDLSEGMVIQGKVVNLTAFGAFVDLGIKVNGLIHISELSDKRVNAVSDVLKVWQIVTVKVIGIDRERGRISLSMRQV